MEEILQIDKLSKSYGKVKALSDLSITVKKGQVFGLLGPNGSGKTTTLGLLLGVLKADSGSFSWFGDKENYNQRHRIGSILETPNFYPYMSAERNLQIAATIKGVDEKDIERVLRKVNLYERRLSPFKTFSLGMKQRLALASALLGKPEVLVLDEPTNGLDPMGIIETRELILQQADEGKTIIIASHLLDEVEKICTHVAILKKGELQGAGRINEILPQGDSQSGTAYHQLEAACADNAALEKILYLQKAVKSIEHKNEVLLIRCETSFTAADINRIAFENKLLLHHLAVNKRRLEEQFLELVK